MSIPDHQLDPLDDAEYCERHQDLMPCRECRFEREMERYESEREEG